MMKIGVNSNLVNLFPDVSDESIGYHLYKDICTTFDAIDVTSFKTLMKYIEAQYCQARNYKTNTGW